VDNEAQAGLRKKDFCILKPVSFLLKMTAFFIFFFHKIVKDYGLLIFYLPFIII